MNRNQNGVSAAADRVNTDSIGRFFLLCALVCGAATNQAAGDSPVSGEDWASGVGRAPVGWVIPNPSDAADPTKGDRVVRRRPASPKTDGLDRRLLWLSTPRLALGEVDALLPAIRDAASQFSLAITATVARDTSSRFQLQGVELGIAIEHDGRWVVTDESWPAKAGRNLGMIEGRTLRRNLENLSPPRVLARSTTFVLFDTRGVARWNEQNRWTTFRHLVWISPKSGRLAFAMWLLSDDPSVDSLTIVEGYGLQLVHEGIHEDRIIYVDGNEVTFMMPSETAFAITALPAGVTLRWSDELRDVCQLRNYQPADTDRLRRTLNTALSELPVR